MLVLSFNWNYFLLDAASIIVSVHSPFNQGHGLSTFPSTPYCYTMSQSPPSTSSSNFDSIFKTAFKAYKKQTGHDITSHPLITWLKTCDSPDAILAVLKAQVEEFDQSRRDDERLTKWLDPTVNVLYAFSATLGEGVGLVFSPAKVIFAGIGVLLLASKDVAASHDVLIDIFERIENFFKRLAAYTAVPQTAAMTDIIVKIMVEVLSIFAIATKEIRQGRAKKFVKKLVGRRDIEDGLQKLDRLTQEEARMATAEVLRLTHRVGDEVKGVSKGVQDVDGKVEGVDERVQGVDERVQGVDERVHGVGEEVQHIDYKVRAIDNRVKQVDHKVGVINDEVKLIVDGGKETTAALQRIVNTVDDISRNQLRRELRNWISPPDPSINYNTACGAHHEGTAAWLTRGDAFNTWKSSGCLLWVHGKPGSGKSILSSVIIRDIEDICIAGFASMAYFYFDFKDTGKQDSRALLSSLLIQLSDQSDVYCDILHNLYSAHRRGSVQPNDDALTQCLKTMLVALETPIYLILDAVDECVNTSGMPSPREKVLRLIKDLVGLKLSNLHLCVTSRPEIDIRNALEPLAAHRISLHDESGQSADIANYVNSVVYSDSRMRRWRAEERDIVVVTLSAKADGMFRWVFCQLEILRHCFPSSVLSILKQLPESLDETYERILREISRANGEHAYRLLQCLTVAVRPLRVEELAEVLAINFNAGGGPKLNTDWRWEDNEEAVLSACSSLVAVVMDGGSRVVQFSHFSVKEFLTSNRLASSLGDESRFHIRLESAHTILAQASLGVLLRLDERVDRDSIVGFPLARYAAEHWPEHVKFENVLSHVKEGIDELFDADKPHFTAWIWLHNIDGPSMSGTSPSQPEAPPLYYAVRIGNRALVEHVLSKRPQDVNIKGGLYETPLHAAFKGDVEIVWLLLENGADVNIRDDLDRTPLHRASIAGFPDVVRWLLDHGVDLEAQQFDHSTALHLAACFGRLNVADVLVKHHAEVNARDERDRLPLHDAACNGHLELVRLLLKHGGYANVRSQDGTSPLDEAEKAGYTEIVNILSERMNGWKNGYPNVSHNSSHDAKKENRPRRVAKGSKSIFHNKMAEYIFSVDVDARVRVEVKEDIKKYSKAVENRISYDVHVAHNVPVVTLHTLPSFNPHVVSSEPGQDLEGDAIGVLFRNKDEADGSAGLGVSDTDEPDGLWEMDNMLLAEEEEHAGGEANKSEDSTLGATENDPAQLVRTSSPVVPKPFPIDHCRTPSVSSSASQSLKSGPATTRKVSGKRSRIENLLEASATENAKLLELAKGSYDFKTANIAAKRQKMVLRAEQERESQRYAAEERALVIKERMQDKEFEHRERVLKYELELARLKAQQAQQGAVPPLGTTTFPLGPGSFRNT
ncbi:hypothetical protein EDB87DRAFT_1830686 [Lactarius vividus]|nr:hypothetical protein EDB87DRAFT_1830686 [Lactarius vividus]